MCRSRFLGRQEQTKSLWVFARSRTTTPLRIPPCISAIQRSGRVRTADSRALPCGYNPVDPFNVAAAGGDQFELDTVIGSDALALAIRADGVRFVRLVSAPARINPDTSVNDVRDTLSNGGDVDGVYGRYVADD